MPDEQTTEPASTTPENPISEPNPVPPIESVPIPEPPVAPESSQTPEDTSLVKDDISANEPFNQPTETAQNPTELQQVEVNPEQNPVSETPQNSPKPEPKTETAQMAVNEPINLAEEIKIKKREENLKLANETRLEKKREKIDKILDLFAKQTNLTNDEVEKLLHVSDATATRYLETLEKEGKIKQVGKTGKGVKYEKI